MTRIEVRFGDITAEDVDVVVNAANSALAGGGGVDGAIHRAGGPTIMAECRAIAARAGGCPPGEAVATSGGLLPARWVVHAVGPIWSPGDAVEHDRVLASAYTRSLDVAADLAAGTVAFPNISTGVYGFPKDRACDVSLDAVRAWVRAHPDRVDVVRFVCFDRANLDLYLAAGVPQA
jgi:O-acetyl-ADP-ribose deacetylase (regulator of RNase III)